MSSPSTSKNGGHGGHGEAQSSSQADSTKPPTVAAFSPNSNISSHRQRSTILVHQKSPLLLATPPQVTRALAYSHPFVVPLNRLVGLLSWTTGDPWESFLVVAIFWLTTLYSSYIIRWTGPILLVSFLILGMYFRRYSPLSSTGWTGEKQKGGHKRDPSDVGNSNIKHHKSLDEILATLQTFTTRCNILLDPFLRLTDFLSTQQTATSATTQPALTTLFIRIMLASPFWWALALPPSPFRILTTKRIVLVFGTILLSWHSRPARISRTILWRSRTVRKTVSFLTGLEFGSPSNAPPPLPPRPRMTPSHSAIALANKRNGNGDEGIRFSFTLFENQRRWLGIGWTSSMLAYERAPWTDEHLNTCSPPQEFELPDVEGGLAKWRWITGSEWRVETGTKPGDGSKSNGHTKAKGKDSTDNGKIDESEDDAWVYYDNKWRDGRRGQDGWGRYTRRRKWIRDAELIDVDPSELAKENKDTDRKSQGDYLEIKKRESPKHLDTFSDTGTDAETIIARSSDAGTSPTIAESETGMSSSLPTDMHHKRRSWFPRPSRSRAASSVSVNEGIIAAGGVGGAVGGGHPSASSAKPSSAATASSGARSVSSSLLSRSAASKDDDVLTPTAILKEREAEWGLGDDVHMALG